ncbi:hypothetical protein [Halostella salina]|uniref:hypothetical protein n=1 Tax=Halostella salina TaxID=1547897 RepID=UPI000EF84F42|nr:hypothetical protein [Halostella salina]
MTRFRSGSSEGAASLPGLLLVWLLVGPSFFGLGRELTDAVPLSVSLSSMGTGLLFGTLVVVSLWIVGVRPSPSATGGYFIAELGLHSLLAIGGGLFLPGWLVSPWYDVLLRSLSIALAAALVFTSSGRRVREFVRKQGLKLVKTPREVNG